MLRFISAVHSVKGGLRRANEMWSDLKMMMELATSARPAEIVAKLERANVLYKKLRKWIEEAYHMGLELEQVKLDLISSRWREHKDAVCKDWNQRH